jgi:hypothetical protein
MGWPPLYIFHPVAYNPIEVSVMSKTSRDKKKSKQTKASPIPPGQPSAAVEAANQPHNAKKEALGPNTRQG